MKHLILVAAIAATTASPTVMAAIYTSASLNNFRLELVDLNLDDGITPTVNFTQTISSQINGTVQFFGKVEDDLDIQDNFYEKGDFNKVLSGSVSDSLSTTSSYYESSENFSKFFSVSGSTTPNSELNYGGYISSSFDAFDFILSPNTQLQIFADSNVFLETTSDGYANYAFVRTFFTAYERLQPFNSVILIDEDSSEFSLSFTNPQTLSELMTLSILISNTNSNNLSGFLLSGATNSGYSDYDYIAPPSPVPTPAAFPLIASALSLFGFGAMRRKATNS